MKNKNVDEFQGMNLEYAQSVCTKKRHCDSTGKTIKVIAPGRGLGRCIACKCNYPAGIFTHNLTNIAPHKYTGKYKSEEEARKARSEASMRWNNKNKDKVAEYRKNYNTKPEVIELKTLRYYLNHPNPIRMTRKRKAFMEKYEQYLLDFQQENNND